MSFGVHQEVLLISAYALFLAGIAIALEWMARKSHRRAEDYQRAGFVHFRDLDYFECPAGHQLVQLKVDYEQRRISYQAPASACNSCSLKVNCTDSDSGRLLERRLDTWIESEVRRFHRVISMTLLLLATLLLGAELFRFSQPQDRYALASLLVPLGIAQVRLYLFEQKALNV
jgi:hypothetical protein